MAADINNHADRDHATWSASSASRNFKCPGALALTMHLPETTSEAADWGTVCHEISEACLSKGVDADSFIGQTLKGKKYSFEVDEEMAETAQVYVDYVRKLADKACDDEQDILDPGSDARPCATLWVEQKFSLASLNPPFDAGGTGDAVIYLPAEKRLEVVDLKGGRGVVVAAKGNPQMRTYALGAMLANRGLDVDRVTITIVQPRAAHPDGRIRSETFHVADLAEWTADMMAAMRRAKAAVDAKDQLPEAAWAAEFLSPGNHCADTFCKAAGTCPALAQKAMDAAGVWFTPLDEPKLSNAPDSGDPDERGRRLDMLDMIEDWVKAVRAHEHRMAESGAPATGYILVEKTGREKFVDAEAEAKAIAVARAAGLPDEKFLNAPKARTPKQIRDAMKKAKADLSALDGLSRAESSGTNLCRADQTSRPAVAAGVEKHFQPIE